MTDTVIQPGELYARHISRDQSSPRKLLGTGLAATRGGINGRHGWQTASIEEAVNEHGGFELKLPNTAGGDGRLHRDRFAVCADDGYHPGDEWIEVWREGDEHPLYVGTPVEPKLGLSTITIAGQDPRAPEVLGKQRETAAGYLLGSPHDVIAELCTAWTVPAVQDFTSPDAPAMGQSAGTQTTADGRLSYLRTDSGAKGARLSPSGSTARVMATATFQTGLRTRVWRAECTIARAAVTTAVKLVVDQSAGGAADRLTLTVDTATQAVAASGASTDTKLQLKIGTTVALAIEGRGRWAFFYVDDTLVAVLPITHDGPVDRVASIEATGATDAYLRSLLVRRRAVFITPAILDRRTAGAPTPTGLLGSYYNETAAAAGQPARNLIPTQDPYARRTDPTIDFPVANPPAWQPAGSPGTTMSVRWTGSIYLDLAATDVRLRTTVDDQATVWVGDTTSTGTYLSSPLGTNIGPWLRTLYGNVSGWYPVIIEYSNVGGPGGIVLEAERGADPGVWVKPGAAAPAPALSPQGIYEHYARYDAHAEQIVDIANQSGVQTRLCPRSLESGEFPARMEIAPRVGRDTDLKLTTRDATAIAREGSSADVASALICEASQPDAAGEDQQIVLEAIAHETIGSHVLLHQDTESLADITDRSLLEQRASSLSALRASGSEQVTARPAGHRKLTDTFPLTGQLAEFRWRAGDGLRRDLPELAVTDASCVQMLRVAWDLTPDGAGAPNVSFRQRPRGLRETLRQIARRAALAQRDHRP